MSLSVEDLCTSLASSHVGQEAIDLAALQVQLAQTLFIATSSSRRQDEYAQPCNTPTRRASTASFSWGPVVDHSRQADLPSHWNSDILLRDEMEEDERMVEDLLLPNSPMSAKPQTPTSTASQAQQGYASDPSPSQFTTTDPFYLAQLQAAQNYGVAPSVFSQAAFPSAQSPFMIHTNLQRHNPVQNPLSMSIDPHPILVAGPTSFDR
ncbi:hypothetical protein GGX14DRAFT_616588 [Mycena pura]|uniref:Uncharacterized protein n=1 Tax=Mycena pura TaxID=153505 RepID=A0AAD7E541_9AGAR|nr:hypothetical protein GGX14DRAFT_616588 [Mycena pura]